MSDAGLVEQDGRTDLDVTRELYLALLAARPFVAATVERRATGSDERERARDGELLDRVDGVLADAGEWLGGPVG